MDSIIKCALILAFGITLCTAKNLECLRRDSTIGQCVPLEECNDPSLDKFFGRQSVPIRCDNGDICCGRIKPTNFFENACNEYNSRDSVVVRQIINGEEVAPGEYPHMAAIGYMVNITKEGQNVQELQFNCGGTLVSHYHILTAAHCILNKARIRPYLVRLGTVNLTSGNTRETDYLVDNFTVHPEYKRSTNRHDIALLKLNRSVKFSTDVHPACLHNDIKDPKSEVIVAGWGNTENGTKSNIMLKTYLNVIDAKTCTEKHNTTDRFAKNNPDGIPQSMLCAHGTNRSDTCQGDSGGPLKILIQNKNLYAIVGVTSTGKECGGTFPGLYTRVAHYLDWLMGEIEST